jgi:hypothetical protein
MLDVMGMFTSVGEEKQYDRIGQSTKLNVVELKVDGY